MTDADTADILSTLSKDELAEERVRLTRYCARFVGDTDIAEDLAQETMLEALRHAAGLRDRQAWRSWLIGIARNVCLRYIKDRTKERERRFSVDSPSILADLVADDTDDPLRVLERNEREKLLDRAMDFLPSGSRDLLVQRYVEDLPVAEIVARQGLTENNLNVRLHRSRIALRQLLFSEPFREEVAAYGLRGEGSEADGWQQTNIWCPRCGEHKLEGRNTLGTDKPIFEVRCIGCREYLGADFTSDHAFFDTRRIMGGVKGFKPALNRLHQWWHEREQSAITARTTICPSCQRRAEVLFSAPDVTPAPLKGILQFYIFCPYCRKVSGPSPMGMGVVHPDVQRFWRRHPRMQGTDPEEILLDNGTTATLAGFRSMTENARIELLFSNTDASLLEINVIDSTSDKETGD